MFVWIVKDYKIIWRKWLKRIRLFIIEFICWRESWQAFNIRWEIWTIGNIMGLSKLDSWRDI